MPLIDEIKEVISKTTGIPLRELTDTTPLYGSGLISSLMLLEIMSAIEKTFHIIIRPEELIEDNFTDLPALTRFISEKKL